MRNLQRRVSDPPRLNRTLKVSSAPRPRIDLIGPGPVNRMCLVNLPAQFYYSGVFTELAGTGPKLQNPPKPVSNPAAFSSLMRAPGNVVPHSLGQYHKQRSPEKIDSLFCRDT